MLRLRRRILNVVDPRLFLIRRLVLVVRRLERDELSARGEGEPQLSLRDAQRTGELKIAADGTKSLDIRKFIKAGSN